jgi:hypothetical protein
LVDLRLERSLLTQIKKEIPRNLADFRGILFSKRRISRPHFSEHRVPE